ncbi:MAG: hydantoinase/oxoprolinase family protein, partial [Gammaproteobacteria bacterium]
ACYGQGGMAATVTDANLVLGRLRPEAFLGGAMTLDTDAAVKAVAGIAAPLGLEVEEAAAGIIRIVNEHMVQALRVISVQRGVDPREHVLVSFGGAGGLHVCVLAEALGMQRALVPVHAGVLSALGMLVAPRARQLSRTRAGLLTDTTEGALDEELHILAEQGRLELIAEGIAEAAIECDFSVDLRYQGQSYTLTLPWQGRERTQPAFHDAHECRYGHRLNAPVELVNIRASLHGRPPAIALPKLTVEAGDPGLPCYVRLSGHAYNVAVWRREGLQAGQCISGPALITETVATTYLPAGWHCRVDDTGNLRLSR